MSEKPSDQGPVRPLKDTPGDDPRLASLLKQVSEIAPAEVDVERGWADVLARAARSGEPVRPLREQPGTDARTAEVVKLVSEIPARSVDVGRGWDDVIERVARPKSTSRIVWFLAAAASASLAVASLHWRATQGTVEPIHREAPAVAVQPTQAQPKQKLAVEDDEPVPNTLPAPELVPAPAPMKKAPPRMQVAMTDPPMVEAEPDAQPPENVTAGPDTVWSVPVDGTLKLDRGPVEIAAAEAPYTVVTPEVSLASTGARYAADVTEGGTAVRVFEGEVEVFSLYDQQQLTMHAGEHRMFMPVTNKSALDIVPPDAANPACARRSLEQRVACLANEAKGDGLRSQSALYEAAYLQARAGKSAASELILRESLRRFPRGVLEPEVRIALMKSLHAQQRLGEAGEVGRDFVASCPDDPRVDEVKGFLRTLEWVEDRGQRH